MRRTAAFALALLLSACGGGGSGGGGFFDRMFGGSSAAAISCPNVAKVGDAVRLTRFVPGGHDLTDVAFEAVVSKIGGTCSAGDNGSVDVQLTVEFIASRGPADKTRKAPFTYFVAIVDGNDNILAREQFNTGIEFPGNQTRNSIVEELDENIPLQKDQRGNQFRVFVGFVLAPEEVAYNRAHP
jgi:hypothetical protein